MLRKCDTNQPPSGQESEQAGRNTTEELWPLLYDELRKLATCKMAREAPGQKLQPTELVHEAYLRLHKDKRLGWDSRNHFISAASEAMRRILVERVRDRMRQKRGGRAERVSLETLELATDADSDTLLQIDEALQQLAAVDSLKAELIELRFFVGMNNRELAEMLGISEPTVKRKWSYARAWLFEQLHKMRNE